MKAKLLVPGLASPGHRSGGRKEIKEWFDAGAFEQQLGCGVGGSDLIEKLSE
jgi:hypothetical protein